MTGTPMLACGPAYTIDGKLLKRTWARGAVTDYSYTAAGELALVDYADATTPDVAYTYDRLGRITQVTDGSGTRTFSYDPTTLAQAAETLAMTGAPSPVTLTRNRDSIGRYTGYALTRSGETLTSATYGYDSIGHLATADNVTFSYEPQSDRIATLTHALADGRTLVSHTAVETNRGLIDYVSHTVKAPGQPDVLVSKYDYANNAIGQRTGVNRTGTAIGTEQVVSYGYDTLGQVTSAQSTVPAETSAYAYDPIGNRLTSTEGTAPAKTYAANNLNQYTQIQGSQAQEPAYDADGNMTTLVNSTGEWAMTWNGENRLVEMTKPDQRLVFAYDSMGRRWKKEVYTGSVGNWTLQSSHRYLYDGYVQITELDAQVTYAPTRSYRWDPTAGKATRVLSMTLHGANAQTLAFTHDGNKNTDSLIAADGSLVGHYAYGPFGQVIVTTGSLASVNSYRFSSEFEDGECGLVYYNYRHYNIRTGSWLSRDLISERGGYNCYSFIFNEICNAFDHLGLKQEFLTFEDYYKKSNIKLSKFELDTCKSNGCIGITWLHSGKSIQIPYFADSSHCFSKKKEAEDVRDNNKDVQNKCCGKDVFGKIATLRLYSIHLNEDYLGKDKTNPPIQLKKGGLPGELDLTNWDANNGFKQKTGRYGPGNYDYGWVEDDGKNIVSATERNGKVVRQSIQDWNQGIWNDVNEPNPNKPDEAKIRRYNRELWCIICNNNERGTL